jgi:hypothetical protein
MEQHTDPQSGDDNQWPQGAQPEFDNSTNPTDAASDDSAKGKPQAGREMVVQLQQMIDTITTQAAPVMRDVAVKAAELAAVAGEKAGPVAYRAAGATEAFGQKVAAKSKEWAAGLRKGQEPDDSHPGAPDDQTPVGGSEPNPESAEEAAEAFTETAPSEEAGSGESGSSSGGWDG